MLVIVTVIFFFAFHCRSVFFGFSRFGELQLIVSNRHNFLIRKHAFQHFTLRSELRAQLDAAAFKCVAASHKNELFAAIAQNGFGRDGQDIGRLSHLDGQNDLNAADLLRLRRTNITTRTSVPIFQLRLRRWASLLDMIRHGVQPQLRLFRWHGGLR